MEQSNANKSSKLELHRPELRELARARPRASEKWREGAPATQEDVMMFVKWKMR